jgi:hypothetical protein
VLSDKIPLIDPELLKLDDLPEATTGNIAIGLWEQRRTQLEADRKALKDERKTAILKHTDPPTDPLQAVLGLALVTRRTITKSRFHPVSRTRRSTPISTAAFSPP